MTTTKKIHLQITMSDRPPITIKLSDWPKVASTEWYSGEIECQANEVAHIRVREHRDGRRIVYGARDQGPGGMAVSYRGSAAGFLVAPGEAFRDAGDGPLGHEPDAEGTVRAIRRVAGVIAMPDLADECIADLPAEELS